MVAKRLDSWYVAAKRRDCWLKIKRCETLACVVIGFVPEGPRDFSALIVATEVNGALVSVGKVLGIHRPRPPADQRVPVGSCAEHAAGAEPDARHVG